MTKSLLTELDRSHLIHPVINFRAHEEKGVKILQSGDGAWLTDIDGKRLLDGFAGLWCVNAGYGQQSVVEAAAKQMSQLPYATGYFGYGSEPAIRLAAKLVELTPASLEHVYFTLGGSDAVDSAIRYITHYYNAIGQPQRKHFIAQERGYHGSSAVGAGMTGLPAFHTNFDLPLANQHHIPCAYVYRSPVGSDPQAIIDASVANLRAKVAELGGPDQVAAFFCEPIIGSGGVLVPPVGWLKAMEATCRELGILLLVDEVITGFGRTGPMFACEAEGVQPDLMTMAKGLTSGYAPMGAVMMSDAIYAGIADGPNRAPLVGHGQTYSAHPVSAAVALEVLRLYQEGGLLANGQKVAPYFAERLQAMTAHPLVGDARQRGLLGALELVADKGTKARFAPELQLHDRLAGIAYENGIIFRAFADGILGFAPALCFSERDFEFLFDRLTLSLDTLLNQTDIRKAVA
ncbi:aminotransferase class III-fold pyridoxal phosphate-dependent enzyme [Pseudomaricurvus alcaniphilus]|uniref:aminotransferase class III-fold pyridoxal phosphate-dependent enzyme n=1 Tax=Pseudomaricurvus alcaniphilus TaxID=1166482 RepID=UPI00140E4D2F|nr:aminotransferase class III-fold pyridoxal phosphate-dependent enzyme [Pseudomaricurvus alcaniphilus]NHN37864.1 aminotransferase class III-fold pyridoxal phosphate-dependent enzyme [Pseudomaricurvus alcaniphilus]